jgi:hypothetical protein
VFSAKSTHEKSAYPTPTLEEAAEGGTARGQTHRPARGTKAKKEQERRGKKIKQKKKKKEKKKKSKRRNTYPRAGQARPKARPALL